MPRIMNKDQNQTKMRQEQQQKQQGQHKQKEQLQHQDQMSFSDYSIQNSSRKMQATTTITPFQQEDIASNIKSNLVVTDDSTSTTILNQQQQEPQQEEEAKHQEQPDRWSRWKHDMMTQKENDSIGDDNHQPSTSYHPNTHNNDDNNMISVVDVTVPSKTFSSISTPSHDIVDSWHDSSTTNQMTLAMKRKRRLPEEEKADDKNNMDKNNEKDNKEEVPKEEQQPPQEENAKEKEVSNEEANDETAAKDKTDMNVSEEETVNEAEDEVVKDEEINLEGTGNSNAEEVVVEESTTTQDSSSSATGGPMFAVDLLPLEVNITVTKLSLDERVGLGLFGTLLLEGSNKYLDEFFSKHNADLLDSSYEAVSLRLSNLMERDPPNLEELLLLGDEAATQDIKVNVTAVLDGSLAFGVASRFDLPSTTLLHVLQLNAFGIPATALSTNMALTTDTSRSSSTGDAFLDSIAFDSETFYTLKEAHSEYLNAVTKAGSSNPYLSTADGVYTDLYASNSGVIPPFYFDDSSSSTGTGRDNSGNNLTNDPSASKQNMSTMLKYAGLTAVAILALSVSLIGFLWMKKRRAYMDEQQHQRTQPKKGLPNTQDQEQTVNKIVPSNPSKSEGPTKRRGDDDEEQGFDDHDPVNETAEMSVTPSFLSKDGSKWSKTSHQSGGSSGPHKSSRGALARASKQIAKAEKEGQLQQQKQQNEHGTTVTKQPARDNTDGSDGAGLPKQMNHANRKARWSSPPPHQGSVQRNVYLDESFTSDEGEGIEATHRSTFFSPRYVDSPSSTKQNPLDTSDDQASIMESSVGGYTYHDQFTIGDGTDYDNMSMGFSLEGDDDLESVL